VNPFVADELGRQRRAALDAEADRSALARLVRSSAAADRRQPGWLAQLLEIVGRHRHRSIGAVPPADATLADLLAEVRRTRVSLDRLERYLASGARD
jgi:hypothetical protein